ncbi:MAG: OmpA family protein [Alphaproteobacteria bacterium]|nr:OmpA family protein [Alphaproteobacteria bacterium]
MNNRILSALLLLLALSACSNNRVVLLPDPDGKVGKVEIITQGGMQILDQPKTVSSISSAKSAPKAPEAISDDKIQSVWGQAMSAMPPPPETFIIYFMSGTSDLTDASEKALPGIITRMKSRPVLHIVVAGHADAVGSDEANIAVSRDRAKKVRDLLVKAGAPPGTFEVSSHGKRNQLFKTPDGVSEPRNRRVSVTIQ